MDRASRGVDHGRYEPRAVVPSLGVPHEMIVPITARMRTNKKVYICFRLALAAMLLAASPLYRLSAAGDIPAPRTAGSQTTGSQTTIVVRADRRTGKLVRSVAPAKTASAAAPVS